MGVQIEEGVTVTDVEIDCDVVRGIKYCLESGETGNISSDIVINCGGMWARELAAKSNVVIPLHACEHFYIVTEPIEALSQLPVLRGGQQPKVLGGNQLPSTVTTPPSTFLRGGGPKRVEGTVINPLTIPQKSGSNVLPS